MKKSLLLLFALSISSVIQAQIPEDGLVGRYELDDNSYLDSTTNGYDLEAVGNGGVTLPVNDRFDQPNKALKFVNEYLNMLSNPNVFDFDGDSNMSMCVWMKIDQTVIDWTGLMNNWAGFGIGGYYLGLTPTQQVRWNINTEPILDSDPVPTGEWIHVAVSYDGSFSKLYLNGQLVQQANLGVSLMPSAYSFTVGAQADVPTNVFPGTMDEILVYERALTDQEVLDIYNNVPLSIEDIDSLSKKLVIAPNPVKAIFSVHTDTAIGNLVSYEITDLKGSVVRSAEISDMNQMISVTDLASGAYIISFKTSYGLELRKRLIKE